MNEDVLRALIKIAVKEARKISNDQEALEVKCLYKEWEKQIGRNIEVGEYIQYQDKLFRVLQAHTVSAEWIPGIDTSSLYVVVDKEHAGTIDDPIPYDGNMELFADKYYIQNNIIYLCIRDSEAPIYHELSALVGNYVNIVE